MTWQEFLTYHTSGENGRPVFIEAQQWLREGWSLDRVMKEWNVGADLLWVAEGVGLIDRDAAKRVAETCIDSIINLDSELASAHIEAATAEIIEGRNYGAMSQVVQAQESDAVLAHLEQADFMRWLLEAA